MKKLGFWLVLASALQVSALAAAQDMSGAGVAPAPNNGMSTGMTSGNSNMTASDGSVANVQGTLPPIIGKWGFGYFITGLLNETPVGVRRWFSESMGFDAGLGVHVKGNNGATDWGFAVDGGLLFALAHLENIIVFIRPGLGFGLNGVDSATNINFAADLMLGGEFFMTGLGLPNLSFTAGIASQLLLTKPDGGKLTANFSTAQRDANIVQSAVLGFHVYM